MTRTAQHARRWPRLTALWLPTVVLGVLSILGAYHAILGTRRTDVQRWAQIAREQPIQSAPRQIESDFNLRFVPSFSARALVLGVPLKALHGAGVANIVSPGGYVFVPEEVSVAYGRSFMDRREKRPRDAIRVLSGLSERLRQQGIKFLAVPVPSKASMLPVELDPEYDPARGPLLNQGHAEWLSALRQAGVEVIDPTETLWKRRDESPLFQTTDTHWSQFAMAVTAQAIAPTINDWLGPDVPRKPIGRRTFVYARMGDLSSSVEGASELRDTLVQALADDRPAQFGDESPVLVIGDSYAEILHDDSASFSHVLALELGLPVQSAAQWGVQARDMARQIDASPGLLTEKKVVVLVFSLRKIRVNNW